MTRPITREEWMKYQWIDVTEFGGEPTFVRGLEYADPPDDEFSYIDVTMPGDAIQTWKRRMTDE